MPVIGIIFFSTTGPSYAQSPSPTSCREFVLDMLNRLVIPGKYATLRIASKSSQKDSHKLDFWAQTIPDAYLVMLEKDPHLPPTTYMTDAVKRKLHKVPLEPVGSVRCPRDIQNEKQHIVFKADLESLLDSTYLYVEKNRITPILKKFLVRFHAIFDPVYRQIQAEVEQKYSSDHSIDYGLSIHERYTDESFGTLRITCRAAALLSDTRAKSQESIQKKLERMMAQKPIMLETVIKTTGRSGKDVELDIAKSTEELNKKMI